MSWTVVAKKEYLENVRNFWVAGVSILFLVLVLATSAIRGVQITGEVSLSGIGLTLASIDTIAGFLLPILALIVAHGTLAGEREAGSLGLLVAQPISRAEILLGKFVGLWSVLATSLVLGVGIAGGIVLARTGARSGDVREFVVFLLVTLLWAAAWTSIAMLLSAWFRRRSTAIAGAIMAWFFFSVIWGILVFLLLLATGGREMFMNGSLEFPPWFFAVQMLNPDSVYDAVLFSFLESYRELSGGLNVAINQGRMAGAGFVMALMAWVVTPLGAAWYLFRTRDV